MSDRLQASLRAEPPAPEEGLRLALWQWSGTAAMASAVADNLARLETVGAIAASHGAHLLAFPELYLSGYFLNPEAARPEVTLLLADCLPAACGPTHPLGTSDLADLRPELALGASGRQDHTKGNGSSHSMVSLTTKSPPWRLKDV